MSDWTARQRVRHHLEAIYRSLTQPELDALADRLLLAAGVDADMRQRPTQLPGSDEVVLITYGDTFIVDGQPHLRSLAMMWKHFLGDVFSTMHVLPFFPSSSDGGFAVVDYRRVDAALGDWSDLAVAVDSSGLMVDLVCNHGSAQSDWFVDFTEGRAPGRDYFLTADAEADLSAVTRPRTHPLLLPVETPAGLKHVWATFSHDQVDFDFSNPDVLVEFCEILGFYLTQGATRVRLDAIAYLWKQIGTNCVHLPETHRVVKLMRAVMDARQATGLLVTETNVPHAENVSYFGDSDEAHLVYNFTLAPLIVWSVMVGQGETLTSWLARLESPPAGCTFLNFLASHDGIGLRPVEDLIAPTDLEPVIAAAVAAGGDFSAYSAPGGPRPYELNVSLADLLAGQGGESAQRFVLAHAIMLAVQGIPAIYVHSMLSSPGDHGAVIASGHKRDINRSRVSIDDATQSLTQGWRGEVFGALSRLIEVRRSHDSFAPEAEQVVHVLHPSVVAIERGPSDDTVFAIHNVGSEPVAIEIPSAAGTTDLITGATVERSLTLDPWQALWLVR